MYQLLPRSRHARSSNSQQVCRCFVGRAFRLLDSSVPMSSSRWMLRRDFHDETSPVIVSDDHISRVSVRSTMFGATPMILDMVVP